MPNRPEYKRPSHELPEHLRPSVAPQHRVPAPILRCSKPAAFSPTLLLLLLFHLLDLFYHGSGWRAASLIRPSCFLLLMLLPAPALSSSSSPSSSSSSILHLHADKAAWMEEACSEVLGVSSYFRFSSFMKLKLIQLDNQRHKLTRRLLKGPPLRFQNTRRWMWGRMETVCVSRGARGGGGEHALRERDHVHALGRLHAHTHAKHQQSL